MYNDIVSVDLTVPHRRCSNIINVISAEYEIIDGILYIEGTENVFGYIYISGELQDDGTIISDICDNLKIEDYDIKDEDVFAEKRPFLSFLKRNYKPKKLVDGFFRWKKVDTFSIKTSNFLITGD